MKNPLAPNMMLAIVFSAAVAAVALRAAASRPGRPDAPCTGPAPVTVMAGPSQGQSQPAVAAGMHDGAGGEMAPPGRAVSAVDQAQHIFHELHAAGRNTFCTVCDSQYGAA
jgi:hypothetical protein